MLSPQSSQPIQPPTTRPQNMLGVIVLYQTFPGAGFQQSQSSEALLWAERFGLYLQNDRLQRSQLRTNDYMKRLQQISTAFPSDVILSKLVENVYQFVTAIVPDPSISMLLTFYDRDTKKIYDVFAIDHGKRIIPSRLPNNPEPRARTQFMPNRLPNNPEPQARTQSMPSRLPEPQARTQSVGSRHTDPEGLHEQPIIAQQSDRPCWWRITQEQQSILSLPAVQQEPESVQKYEELLKGTWGDQSSAESFLLLPMKMYTRVIGSLSLASMRPEAFSAEDILALETMVQLITVDIENAKLYDRAGQSVKKARQREESLAAMNSALLAISSVLNLTELLHKFVETSAKLVQADLCTFFQLTPDGEELVAQAIYDSTGKWKDATQTNNREKHDDLIEMIRLPFRNALLAQMVDAGSFFYLDSTMLEELAQASGEGGAIFLRETHTHKMLMIPVRYQAEIVGILAVHTPGQDRVFRPEEVSTLLGISSQGAIAIRNAQLFAQIRDANAELKRMDKLKDEFIVTASHELRTPLSAISGYASLLKRQSSRITAQQVLRYGTKISGATQQLIDLVANMTEAAKMGAIDKKLELQFGPVQLLAAAEIASTMLSINIEQKIAMHIDPQLWVNCDALPLRQVITNLLDNAAKYSPPTGQIVITASATTLSQLPEGQADYGKFVNGEDTEVVLVRVRDEGDGIPLEDQDKIFEKFVRASRSLTTPVRGSGLGLYICRRYIEAMGGKLWLEMSVPGEGSIFSFFLPRIDAPPIES